MALPEVHTGCCCISQTQACRQRPGFGCPRKQSHGQRIQGGYPPSQQVETTALRLEEWGDC